MNFYENDSIHSLNTLQQTGLIILSLTLASLTLWATYRLIKNRHWSVRLGLAVSVFFVFIWLSPQIYYTYYLFLWPNLPFQTVIQQTPELRYLLELAAFQGKVSTAAHAQGALGVCLLLLAFFTGKRHG